MIMSTIELNQSFSLLFLEMIVATLISRLAYKCGYYHFPEQTQSDARSKEAVISGRNVFAVFAIFFFIELIFVPTLYLVWETFEQETIRGVIVEHANSDVQSILNLIGIFSVAAALIVYLLRLPKSIFRQLFGERSIKDALYNLLMGVLTWIIAYPWIVVLTETISIILLYTYGETHIEQLAVKQVKQLLHQPALLWITAFAVVIVVPILEELLFRGFLLTWLKGYFGRYKAIIITSVIFSLFHYSSSQGIENINLIVALFLLSCYLGFIRERQQSVLASIGLHSTFNCVSVIMILS